MNIIKTGLLAIFTVVIILTTDPAFAAVDMFIKIQGIDGESEDDAHRDEIDVLSWSMSATHSTKGLQSSSSSAHQGTGGGAGKVSVQDLNFTHFVDKSSANIYLHCTDGTHIPDAILTVRKAGMVPVEYVKIILTDVIVSSVQINAPASVGEDRLTENVTLNFGKMETVYMPQRDDGSSGETIDMKWDNVKNKKDK